MQRVREELLDDVGASLQIFHPLHCSVCPPFSSVGARVGGAGPCSCDGAPISTASLNCGGVEFRRSTILPWIFTERPEQLGCEPAANVAHTLLEKKSILHELEEKVTKSEMNDNPNVCAGLSQKNKTELRDMCKALRIPLSGHETKPQLTTKMNEVRALRQANRALQTTTREDVRVGVCAHDTQYCEWAVLTVVEDGATASPQPKKFASHVQRSLGTFPRLTSSPRRKLHSRTTKLDPEEELADLVKRVEYLQAMVRQRKDKEVQCNLKTMNEQQRAMLRKSGK